MILLINVFSGLSWALSTDFIVSMYLDFIGEAGKKL